MIIPAARRFISHLYGRPAWEIERTADGRYRIGNWEGLEVFCWPDEEIQLIVVGDSRKLFGKNADEMKISVAVKDMPESERALLVSRAPIARLSEVPESPCAVVRYKSVPRVGINDSRAAISISVSGSDACYLYEESDFVCHRPSCEVIKGRSNLVATTCRGNLKNCNICQSFNWDGEDPVLEG